ncbi:Acyl-protein thioesterase 1 like [Verticillium longisporum]|nr:Acyl-protein thioesterase 1 like [Verticillium longisporum]
MHVISEEEDIVGRENVFLGGISQGFATAVAAFFIGGEGLAGLIGMSSWMPEIEPATITFAPERIPVLFPSEPEVEGPEVETGIRSTRKTPVFLAHNADDDVVPLRNGVMLRDALRARGDLDVEWHEYGDGGHWFNEPQGMDDLVGFLKIAGVPCQPQSLVLLPCRIKILLHILHRHHILRLHQPKHGRPTTFRCRL